MVAHLYRRIFIDSPSARRSLAVVVCVIVTIATLFILRSAPAHATAPVTVTPAERAQLKLINRYRAAHHMRPLRFDRTLQKTARWMATDMPRHAYFGHIDHLQRNPFRRLDHFRYPRNTWRGENLAAGNGDVGATFQQWVDSPEHRHNMLTPRYRAVGLARVCIAGSEYDCYWVTEFGSKVSRRV